MNNNPLFSGDDNQRSDNASSPHDRPLKHVPKPIAPPENRYSGQDSAVSFMRQKVAGLYAEEPNAEQEIKETKIFKPQSIHQKFMAELSASSKSLADIQVAWHNYYTALPEPEKHEVWNEFYELNSQTSRYSATTTPQTGANHQTISPSAEAKANKPENSEIITSSNFIADESAKARPSYRKKTPTGRKPKPIHNKPNLSRSTFAKKAPTARASGLKSQLKSLAFGLSMGTLVLVIFLFSFFNQIIIAPFIQPGRTATNTPLIVNASSISPTKTPEVIIPKINVEIPVDYSLATDDENTIENALENGVIHYATTVLPGQNGNIALFGHSSNNIFNPGHYKFAFVLLHTLVPGDTFYLTYNGQVYVYQVFKRQIVNPNDVGVLSDSYGKQATATLITCDPPGTSLNRLVVTGEQISPSPAGNSTAKTPSAKAQASATTLANNGPSLWSRIIHIF